MRCSCGPRAVPELSSALATFPLASDPGLRSAAGEPPVVCHENVSLSHRGGTDESVSGMSDRAADLLQRCRVSQSSKLKSRVADDEMRGRYAVARHSGDPDALPPRRDPHCLSPYGQSEEPPEESNGGLRVVRSPCQDQALD
jgi:hypothetical protein